jgi:hypothetical protein
MDETSRSDIKEVTALLRGKRSLSSAMISRSVRAAFIEDAKVERLASGFLKDQSLKTLLLPGASLYDLAKVIPESCSTNRAGRDGRYESEQPTKYARTIPIIPI